MRTFLRLTALAAVLTWGWLCLLALRGPESHTAREGRTLAFVVAFGAASLG